ncbi:nitroreductase/quinone reductase family protein [Umezawaea sp. Da 62-37]|uniref:nitroreductase/quinone reductase family protein n=1 Tax=Umezawaea sp. Da 62-37 TaxID=3075927 RepID=UPI0028F749A0|nr:nitroreductase/quinone reductase family protein [Umezawaea sp. Da 62-37]WNV88196.1 nitroreductase/quinone reductase family protein [Umezawaea sp. Da 62-37]
MTDPRTMNTQMAARILGTPAEPVPEGGYALRVVRTRGRRSGEPRDTPIGVTRLHDRHYLVSPDRSRDWVRNLITTPECDVLAGAEAEPCTAVPAAGEEAATVVSTYLTAVTVPWALRAFPVAPGAPIGEITAHLGSIAVFRLEDRA